MVIKTKKIDAGFILLAMLLILSGFIVLMSNISAEGTEDLKFNDEPQSRATNPARLEIDKSVAHSQIFVKDSGLNPEKTRITITVKGVGYPGVEYNPQDTVFIMDNSDSMDESDNEFKRVEALKLYLETMLPPDDRAAVIKFSRDAELINDHHLTSNYTQIIEDLPALWHTSGLTNLGAAVALANEELIQYSDTDKILVEILLTDGRPEPPENNVTMKTINEAIDNEIKIYTVGLGEDHDAKLLRWIANMTGGKYYYAREAEDLIEIYNEISNQFHNYTAGTDPDITDSDPMVRDVLPYWVDVEQGSFSIEPDHTGPFLGDTTRLEWNISRIAIGETWTVSYNISVTEPGDTKDITVAGHARVRYLTQKGTRQTIWFDALSIKVLPRYSQFFGPPPPPPLPPAPLPVSGFPVPAPPPATTVPIPLAPGQFVATASPAGIPLQYFMATFVGLGIADRIKQMRMIKSRQKVAIGV